MKFNCHIAFLSTLLFMGMLWSEAQALKPASIFCAAAATAVPDSVFLVHWNNNRCPDGALVTQHLRSAFSPDSSPVQPYIDGTVDDTSWLSQVFRIHLPGSISSSHLAEDTCIDFYEPLPKARFCGWVDDPGLSGLAGSVQSELEFLRVPEAWTLTNMGDSLRPNLSIGIADTWVDTAHEDLPQPGSVGYMLQDGRVHGTAVAGLACAHSGNGLGIASAAGNSLLHTTWRSDPDYAVLELAQQGAKVIVVPWINRCTFSPIQQHLYDKIRNMGSLVVAGAGNGTDSAGCGSDGQALAYPASLRGVLSVSSVGHRWERGETDPIHGVWHWKDVHALHPFELPRRTHTHNDSVDLVAPGYGLLTTVPGNAYAEAWGTSFSAGLAGSVAALVWSANPCLGPDDISRILRETAYRVDTLPENAAYIGKLGSGRIRADLAIQKVLGEDSVVLGPGEHPDWTTMRRIHRALILETGARLRIRGPVYFDSEATVILRPGSRLELDSALLQPVCDGSWKGIQVEGNPNREHPTAGIATGALYPASAEDHAVLLLRRGSQVTGADTAVVSKGGGMVFSWDSELTNNRTALMLRDYPFAHNSHFQNTRFSWRDRAPDRGSELTAFRRVNGVTFSGCTWESAFDVEGTAGIAAQDAGMLIGGSYCTGSSCPGTSPGLVRGFDLGLEAWTSTGFTPGIFRLEDMVFDQCRRSILLRGLDAPVLRRLSVDIPASYGVDLTATRYGVHLEACRRASVLESTIHGSGGGDFGLLVYEGSADPALIQQCSIEDCWVGLAVLGHNGNNRSGLQLSCNRFLENDYAVWLAPGESPASLASYQGDCFSRPAGNAFVSGSSFPDWVIHPGSRPLTYAHHEGGLYRPSVSDSSLIERVSCERVFEAGDCPRTEILPLAHAPDSIAALQLQILQLEATFDNGNTADLLRLVNASTVGSGVLQFAVSEANPYLSDTVLLALLARFPNVPGLFFRHILESNSPLSPDVLHHALAVLPDGLTPLLQSWQTHPPSPREALRARISSLRHRLSRWECRLQITYRTSGDTSALLGSLPAEALGDALLALQRWTELANWAEQPGADTLPNAKRLELPYRLQLRSQSLKQLSDSEILELEDMALWHQRQGTIAQGMLRVFDGRRYPEPIPEGSPDLSLRYGVASGSHPGAQAGGRREYTGLSLYPNPAGDWLYLAVGGHTSMWTIYNALGTEWSKGTGVTSGQQMIRVANLPPGVYYLRCLNADGAVQVFPFVKRD